MAALAYLFSISLVLIASKGFALEAPKWRDALEAVKSPVTTKARYALLTGGLTTAAVYAFEEQISDPIQKSTVEHQPLGRTSNYGNLGGLGISNAIYALGFLTHSLIAPEDDNGQNFYGMVMATAYASLTTTAIKHIVREPRPYNPNVRDSFPSGHSTLSFAFASYVACRHSLGWGVTAYTLATFVAFSRINDNAHYLHDVLGGATVGTSYGMGVCQAQNEMREGAKAERETHNVDMFTAAPRSGGAVGIWTRSF